jgi:hypothetical protein
MIKLLARLYDPCGGHVRLFNTACVYVFKIIYEGS